MQKELKRKTAFEYSKEAENFTTLEAASAGLDESQKKYIIKFFFSVRPLGWGHLCTIQALLIYAFSTLGYGCLNILLSIFLILGSPMLLPLTSFASVSIFTYAILRALSSVYNKVFFEKSFKINKKRRPRKAKKEAGVRKVYKNFSFRSRQSRQADTMSSIYLIMGNWYNSIIFQGAVLDTGAPKSCIGIQKERAYTRHAEIKELKLDPPTFGFVLGDSGAKCLGVTTIFFQRQGEILLYGRTLLSKIFHFYLEPKSWTARGST